MNHADALPLQLNERADILDSLRGFALLGVLLDNLFGFTGWAFLNMQQREALPTWPLDGIFGMAELAFIHGKFYSIFSLLFGIGFSVILIRNEQRGVNPLKIFYRRLLMLAIIGAGHLLLIWEGDILFLYALVGMLLPLFRNCSNRTVLIWAITLILCPIVIDVIRVIFQLSPGKFLYEQAVLIDAKNNLPTDSSLSQYIYTSTDSWMHWRKWIEPGFFYRYADLLNGNRIPKVLGMFLFGFYAGRRMMYINLQDHISLFKKLRKWGFIIGIPAGIATAIFEVDEKSVPKVVGLIDTILYAVSVVPLCLAYVSAICLQWIKKEGSTKWKLLAPVGRMALTNYLMQSAIGIILFYGVGFGLGGDIGPSLYFPIGICIYILQILYSTWWMKHFNYGPFEWIWRMLTYWKWLPIRKQK
jgi:uncharacterized protein